MEIREKERDFQEATENMKRLKEEIKKYIVGQEETIDQILWTIFAGGHALLEGHPGLGKTMLVKTIAHALHLSFSRIQFTPDLMPSDITGTMLLQKGEKGLQRFVFHEGPLFHNLVLADEINRATPKTQSALLEAMGEQTVTVMGETKEMPAPFFVLATQNPIDMEGTYPLPEAQMDRFLCKILVRRPEREELMEIARRTTGTEEPHVWRVMEGADVIRLQNLAREILISEDLLAFAVDVVLATHPDHPLAPEPVKKYVQFGSGPRGLQAIVRLAKARALFSGRYNVSRGDVKRVAAPALRHRIIRNFEGEAEGIFVEQLIEDLLEYVETVEEGS